MSYLSRLLGETEYRRSVKDEGRCRVEAYEGYKGNVSTFMYQMFKLSFHCSELIHTLWVSGLSTANYKLMHA